MLGAIAGDIIGSAYEFNNIRSTDFPLFGDRSDFTDDTVLTIATADCILNNGKYPDLYKKYFRAYPDRGYGGNFINLFKMSDTYSGRIRTPYRSEWKIYENSFKGTKEVIKCMGSMSII